jgi:hypothetical protein
LGRRTDLFVAVSAEVRDELVELGLGTSPPIAVVPLGFNLSPFLVADPGRAARRRALRAELGISDDARVVILRGWSRIKRVDRFLRVANLLRDDLGATFMIVGGPNCATTCTGPPRRNPWAPGLYRRGFVETCRTSTSPAMYWFGPLTTKAARWP